MVPLPPNSIFFTHPHVVPLHMISSHIVCRSIASHMMSTGRIGCSDLSMSFVIGNAVGRGRVICMVMGCSWLFTPYFDRQRMVAIVVHRGGCFFSLGAPIGMHSSLVPAVAPCYSRFRMSLRRRRWIRMHEQGRWQWSECGGEVLGGTGCSIVLDRASFQVLVWVAIVRIAVCKETLKP